MPSITQIFERTQNSAMALLKEDHKKVKEIFERFEAEDTPENEKKGLAETALVELTIHAEIEEEIYYPAVRAKMDDEDIMDEALEEHHVAKLLIKELVESGLSGERFEAKFTVLAESVRHHIKEEEDEMMPKAGKVNLDFEQLGQQMMERKQELMGEIESLSDLRKLFRKEGSTRAPARTARRAAARPTSRRGSRGRTRAKAGR
jgi:hypothetical protein